MTIQCPGCAREIDPIDAVMTSNGNIYCHECAEKQEDNE